MDLPVSSFVSHLYLLTAQNCQFMVALHDGFPTFDSCPSFPLQCRSPTPSVVCL